uniref:Uncharacterized protein n=1 Tax=Panagrolaimus sp. ES5 TaxID=591445 RepID=A0AC34GMB3_9BILA
MARVIGGFFGGNGCGKMMEEFLRDCDGDERARGVMAAVEDRPKISAAFGSNSDVKFDKGEELVDVEVDVEEVDGRGGSGGGGPVGGG